MTTMPLPAFFCAAIVSVTIQVPVASSIAVGSSRISECGTHSQHARDGDQLFLATGEAVYVAPGKALDACQPHGFRNSFPGVAHSQVARPEGDIIFHPARDHLVFGLLEDQPYEAPGIHRVVPGADAVHEAFAGIGQKQAVHDLGERGLARGSRPHDHDMLAARTSRVTSFSAGT